MPYRVPTVDSQNRLPASTKVRESNLPGYLQPGSVVTPEQLENVAGLTPETVAQMIAQARADVLAQVNAMLQNLPAPQSAFIINQPVPVATVTVEHNLGRRAVAVTVYSLDYETIYEFAEVYPQDENTAILSFGNDPLAFVAIFS